MSSPSRIEVDLTGVSSNVRTVRRVLAAGCAGGTVRAPGICAVMKADGYGLGAARIAKRLAIAGVDMFAVYTPDQARTLIDAAVMNPILVMMPAHELDRSDPLYRAATRGQLHFTIHGRESFEAIAAAADLQGLTLMVHLEVDTGMSRGGVPLEDARGLVESIVRHPRLRLAGVSNHFACADSDDAFTRAQSQRFGAWLAACAGLIPGDCVVHEANTFGCFRGEWSHRGMVRIGLAILGYGAEEFADRERFAFAEEATRLRPAMRWLSEVIQVKRIGAGTPVGYGAVWRAGRPTRLGLVPVGYADGYPLALSNKAKVGVTLRSGVKAFVPVVGRISMDQMMIDLTDLPVEEVGCGADVEVVGNDPTAPNHLPTLARQAGTITHELLCRVNARLQRQYIAVDQPAPVSVASERIAV